MAGSVYTCDALVLRKTKLGETDLILSLLAEDGSQIRAVAKGARKPASPFATRLDLYCVAHVLLAEGKNLDIVKEARLVARHDRLSLEPARFAEASVAAELIDRVTQPGLEIERLFPATVRGFQALQNADDKAAYAVTAAFLLKTLAFSGLRPSLDRCASCGSPLPSQDLQRSDRMWFSVLEGGVVCAGCAPQVEAVSVSSDTIAWAKFLLDSTYDAIEQQNMSAESAQALLNLISSLVQNHVGVRLKSLDYLLTSGVME